MKKEMHCALWQAGIGLLALLMPLFIPVVTAGQNTDTPRIVLEAQRGVVRHDARLKLYCRPTQPEKAAGWRVQDSEGHAVNFRLQAALCGGASNTVPGTNIPAFYVLNWMVEGIDNPRLPHSVILYATDFRELLPNGVSAQNMAAFQKSLIGDLFDLIKPLASYITRVVKAIRKLIADYDRIKQEVETIIQDAGELLAALMGKSSPNGVAPMVAQEARLMKHGGLMPHQIYASALSAGMSADRRMTDTFIQVVSQLHR